MSDRLDPRIVAVINAARFCVWRRDMTAAELLFTRAQVLLREIHGLR